MRNYRIACLTADWNYELVENTLHGMKHYVAEHENVQVCVFDCFGKDIGNDKDQSEYRIFDLMDLHRFDGVLIHGNQIVLESAREKLRQRLAEAGIPAVTIGCRIEGCTLMGVDNYRAQRDIAEHVIRDHGVRRMAYLTGILDNGCPEGEQRMQGFLDVCEAYGVSREEVEIFPCTWRTSDGHRVAEKWLSEGRPMPDAFVCANDEMALGVIETLGEHGIRIPQDVIVVGFDNVDSAELSSPRLSTITTDFARLNYQALEVLIHKIDGAEPPPWVPFPHELVCSESCGCAQSVRSDYIRRRYFRQTRFLKNFYAQQDQMAEALFNASDLEELLEIIEKNRAIFGSDNVYVCINDFYFDNYEKSQWPEHADKFGQDMVLAACGERMGEPDEKHEYARFPAAQLLPEEIMAGERFLVFYPLHYNTYSLGFLAMNGVSEAAKLNLHESIFNFLEIAMENVRKKCLLRKLNVVLDDLYVRDALTGVYNRFGFKRFGQELFDRFMREEGGAQILFVDMDDMKGINDRFGHEMGDCAIRAAAQAIQSASAPQDFLMRYGGDEFLLIASIREENLEEDIAAAVRRINQRQPFELRLSVGIIRAGKGDGRTLEACVQEADTLMYQQKKRHKQCKAPSDAE